MPSFGVFISNTHSRLQPLSLPVESRITGPSILCKEDKTVLRVPGGIPALPSTSTINSECSVPSRSRRNSVTVLPTFTQRTVNQLKAVLRQDQQAIAEAIASGNRKRAAEVADCWLSDWVGQLEAIVSVCVDWNPARQPAPLAADFQHAIEMLLLLEESVNALARTVSDSPSQGYLADLLQTTRTKGAFRLTLSSRTLAQSHAAASSASASDDASASDLSACIDFSSVCEDAWLALVWTLLVSSAASLTETRSGKRAVSDRVLEDLIEASGWTPLTRRWMRGGQGFGSCHRMLVKVVSQGVWSARLLEGAKVIDEIAEAKLPVDKSFRKASTV